MFFHHYDGLLKQVSVNEFDLEKKRYGKKWKETQK